MILSLLLTKGVKLIRQTVLTFQECNRQKYAASKFNI